jgi:dimethylargininase
VVIALVRPPGDSFARALSSQVPQPSLDPGLARKQHAEYRAALREAGAQVVELPADEEHPDACFVQDTAVIVGNLAFLARFGVESRQGEQEAVREVLQGQRRLVDIEAPAWLEGGDVLVIGSRVFVGLSARTNRAGFAQMRDVLELEGATVEAVPVSRGLHLLSGCTYLGEGVLVAVEEYAGLPWMAGLDLICVPPGEAAAANALALGRYVILPTGFSRTASAVRGRGFEVLPIPLSEFAKADGGPTCLSLIF